MKKQDKSIIYSSITKSGTVISQYTPYVVRFVKLAQHLMKDRQNEEFFIQKTQTHTFYSLKDNDLILMVLVDSEYPIEYAFTYLKQLKSAFREEYPVVKEEYIGEMVIKTVSGKFERNPVDTLTLSEREKITSLSDPPFYPDKISYALKSSHIPVAVLADELPSKIQYVPETEYRNTCCRKCQLM